MKPSREKTTRPTSQALWRLLVLVALVLAATIASIAGTSSPGDEGATSSSLVTAKPVIAAAPVVSADADPGYNQRVSLETRGRVVYDQYCVGCHGVNGDGNGPATPRLQVRPRDFTSGIYKFRSTDSGSLPLDTDLHRTITRGLARVSMPAFPLISEQDRLAVVAYIKSFYPKWEREAGYAKVVHVPRAPTDLTDAQRIDRGRVVYLAMGCSNCHGSDGAGQGATQKEYIDAWGQKVKAFNFTRGRLKGGDDPEDVYRTFHTGLRSVMPSFGGQSLAYASHEGVTAADRFMAPGEADRLRPALADFPQSAEEIGAMSDKDRDERTDRNSWDLVAYILSLRRSGPRPGAAASVP